MTYHAPMPTPTGPVDSDIDTETVLIGISFIAVSFLIWPAVILVYELLMVLVSGGTVVTIFPTTDALIELAGFALLAGLVSGSLRLVFRRNSEYLMDLAEAVIDAASGGSITIAAIVFNMVIGAVIGIVLGFFGISSPLDVVLEAQDLFAPHGAVAIVLGGAAGGREPPAWWEVLLTLFLLLQLIGLIVGLLAAGLMAAIASMSDARAGPGGAGPGAAMIVSLTRLWRMEPNPEWDPFPVVPRNIGTVMTELAAFDADIWQRAPRRDLFENYRRWLEARGLDFSPQTFIENLPEHRDWLREKGTTKGQRYLGAFADHMEDIIQERQEAIQWHEFQDSVPKRIFSDDAPSVLAAGDPLVYPGWIGSALATGVASGAATGFTIFLILGTGFMIL